MLRDELASRQNTRRGARNRKNRSGGSMLLVHARTSEQRTERLHKIGAVVLLLIVFGGSLWLMASGARGLGRVFFSDNDLFRIRKLDLRSDGRLLPSHIREYAQLTEGLNLFALDIDQVRRNLASVPLVKQVKVTRRLPGELQVQVTERVPQARIRPEGAPIDLAVDQEGFIMGPPPRGAVSPLPLLQGVRQSGLRPGARIADPLARMALEIVHACDSTRFGQYIQIQSVNLGQGDVLELELEGRERVLLPSRPIEPKLKKLAAILKTIRDGRMADPAGQVVIDMTSDSNFPVSGLKR